MTTEVMLALLAISVVVAFGVPYVLRAPGRRLRRTFVALGTLKGRRKAEIIRAAGEPATVTILPDGRSLLQWRATGYHIALVFEKNGVCFGVTHEYGRRRVV